MTAFQAGLIQLRMEDYPKDLSGVDVAILTTLFSFAADDDRPRAFPSAAKIAARSRFSERTVQRALERLEKVGVITGEHRHRRPTRWSLDPYFIKTGGVTKSPDAGGSQPAWGGSVNATEAPGDVTETQGSRHSGGQHASGRRTANATAADQCTEVGSGAKRRNRTDVTRGGSASSGGSAGAPPTSSPPPPPRYPGALPPGVTPLLNGKPVHPRTKEPR